MARSAAHGAPPRKNRRSPVASEARASFQKRSLPVTRCLQGRGSVGRCRQTGQQDDRLSVCQSQVRLTVDRPKLGVIVFQRDQMSRLPVQTWRGFSVFCAIWTISGDGLFHGHIMKRHIGDVYFAQDVHDFLCIYPRGPAAVSGLKRFVHMSVANLCRRSCPAALAPGGPAFRSAREPQEIDRRPAPAQKGAPEHGRTNLRHLVDHFSIQRRIDTECRSLPSGEPGQAIPDGMAGPGLHVSSPAAGSATPDGRLSICIPAPIRQERGSWSALRSVPPISTKFTVNRRASPRSPCT